MSTWWTNLSLVAALRPLEALSTSRTVAMSRPTEAANATASLVAASAVADRKLLASLSAFDHAGAVADVEATVAQPLDDRLHRGARSRIAAYITVSVRVMAPAAPPETGAST